MEKHYGRIDLEVKDDKMLFNFEINQEGTFELITMISKILTQKFNEKVANAEK